MNNIFSELQEMLEHHQEQELFLEQRRLEAISEAIIEINKEYEPKVQKEKRNALEIKKKLKEVSELSKLKTKVIGKILANLISEIENSKYVFVRCYTSYEKRKVTSTSNYLLVLWRDVIVKKGLLTSEEFKDKGEQELIDSGDYIILQKGLIYDKNEEWTSLYEFEDGKASKLQFEKFPYVEEFINLIISYRIKKDENSISKEELEQLLQDYLSQKLGSNRKRQKK